jgi:hypothetical protein
MNTQNSNQQLYGEPSFVHGTAGKKQVYGEPQWVTGEEKHAEQLTPLYADNDITTHREHKAEHSQKAEQEHVHLTIHTDDPSKINLESLFQITPDGQIKINTDEDIRRLHHEDKHSHSDDRRHTEHLHEPLYHEDKHYHSDDRRHTERLHEPLHYEDKHYHSDDRHHTEHLHEPLHHEEKHYPEHGSLKTKKASRRLSDRVKHRDETVIPTETTTIVKVGKHEPGTAGYVKDVKSDTHYRTDAQDTHHRTDAGDTHHRTDATKIKIDRAHSTEHEHVSKSEHLKAKKASKKKRLSDKARRRDDTSESTTATGHHGHDKQHSESYVKAGTLSKPHEHEKDAHGRHLVQQLRTTLNDSETPNMAVLGELLLRAEALLAKSAHQTNIDPEARKTLDDISTMLITAKQLERHKHRILIIEQMLGIPIIEQMQQRLK